MIRDLEGEDKKAIAIIKAYDGLDSDASVVRFVLSENSKGASRACIS